MFILRDVKVHCERESHKMVVAQSKTSKQISQFFTAASSSSTAVIKALVALVALVALLIYHEIQITIKQNSYTKANESGEEAQKETMRLIDIGLPQSKNKVNINGKAWIESKIQ